MCPACGKFVETKKRAVGNGKKDGAKKSEYDLFGVLSVTFIGIGYALYAVIIGMSWVMTVLVGASLGATAERIAEVGFAYLIMMLIPLIWNIPSFIVLLCKVSKKKKIHIAFKIFVLVACSVLSGIFLLFRDEKAFENKERNE